MRSSRQPSARAWVSRRGDLLAACVAGAWLFAGCGDAAGHPIRSPEPDAALLHDGGGDGPDAGHFGPDPEWFPMGGRPGPGSMHDGQSNDDDIPHNMYCIGLVNWSPDDRYDEMQMQQAINIWRSGRVDCGNNRETNQLPPLSFPPALRCSARVHSVEMFNNQNLSTIGAGGSRPGDRMTWAGFPHGASAESVWDADGDGNVYSVLAKLLNNSDDCENFASQQFTAAGVGEYHGVWTFDFAAEP